VDALLGIFLRVVVMYLLMLMAVRSAGKRGVGHISPQDFVTAVIIGDMFDDVFWAEIPVAKGIVGVMAIVATHILISLGTYKSEWLERMIGSKPVVLIKHGITQPLGLRAERLRRSDLDCLLRHHSIDSLTDVKEARMEPLGTLSVLHTDEKKPADRRDLAGLREALK
jgi:uncharacterized membrane protein YcaP (DUF421 family)